MSKTKTRERVAVEFVLKQATIEKPMSAAYVAALVGLSLQVARNQISKIVENKLAFNIDPGHRGSALYAWGRPEKVVMGKGEVAGPRMAVSAERYIGEKRGYIDPVRLEFLSKPSRVGDECFEWRRPMINGASMA